MKKALVFVAFLFLSFSSFAQVVATKGTDGNYTQTEVVKTAEQLTEGCEKSSAMFTDKKGQKFPVYLSKSGKMFYIATSKAGKPYRRYFKVSGE